MCLPPVAILKALAGYRAQCTADPHWVGSFAEGFCQALESAMIRALPGYAEAPWDITADTFAAPRAPLLKPCPARPQNPGPLRPRYTV